MITVQTLKIDGCIESHGKRTFLVTREIFIYRSGILHETQLWSDRIITWFLEMSLKLCRSSWRYMPWIPCSNSVLIGLATYLERQRKYSENGRFVKVSIIYFLHRACKCALNVWLCDSSAICNFIMYASSNWILLDIRSLRSSSKVFLCARMNVFSVSRAISFFLVLYCIGFRIVGPRFAFGIKITLNSGLRGNRFEPLSPWGLCPDFEH